METMRLMELHTHLNTPKEKPKEGQIILNQAAAKELLGL